MNNKFRKFLKLACVIAILLASLGASQSTYANDISTDNFLPKALVSYENLMSKSNMEEEGYLSDTIIQLVEERQSFYQKYFIEGLNSDLVNIESEFDQTTMKAISSSEIKVVEIVNLTGITKLQKATDYPPYQASLLALKAVEGKDQELSLKLEAYASNILEGVQQSIDESEFTISIVNQHTMAVDYEKGIVLTDYYSSESVDDPGTDKVVLLEGKSKRVEPDFSLMPDHIMYVTPIDELAFTLLNDLSASSSVFSTSAGPTTSRSYSGSTAASYIRSYVRNTTTTCATNVYQNQIYWNSSYTKYWCSDCANYVSQALDYGGMSTTSTWQPYTYAWINVSGLTNYIISNDFGYYISSTLLGLGDLGLSPNTHVVMVSGLSPIRYSAHTSDRLNYAWQTSLTHCIHVY